MTHSNRDLEDLKADVQFPNLQRYSERAKADSFKTEEFMKLKFPDSFVKIMKNEKISELSLSRDITASWNIGYIEELWYVSTIENVMHLTREARMWDSFPKDCVAIADDECGNFLVFKKVQGDILGAQVFFWSHETGELTKIAEDFNDLVGSVT